MENYYEILGVSENATQDEIKKAFRNKSKVMHPDKGGNEEDFKKINEAYDTIGDQNKRAQYDQQKNNPFGGGFGGDNPFDIFSQMFGNFGGQQQRKAPDKIVDLNIGVVDSFLGKQMDVNYTRKTSCNPCNGSGGDKETCNVCNGQGSITQRVGNSFFSNIVRTPCGKCQGRGYTFKNICQSWTYSFYLHLFQELKQAQKLIGLVEFEENSFKKNHYIINRWLKMDIYFLEEEN